jgi:hypothetical protein
MNISRKIMLTGVVTLGVFALGSAGAAVAHTLTIEDHTGVVQNITPVTTGTTSPSPNASPFDDKSDDPTGTTTVVPAPPVNVDEHGEAGQSDTADGAAHDLGDDNVSTADGSGHDGAGHDGAGHNPGGSGVSGSGAGKSGSTSGSGASDDSGPSGGSGHDDGSSDTGGHQ